MTWMESSQTNIRMYVEFDITIPEGRQGMNTAEKSDDKPDTRSWKVADFILRDFDFNWRQVCVWLHGAAGVRSVSRVKRTDQTQKQQPLPGLYLHVCRFLRSVASVDVNVTLNHLK